MKNKHCVILLGGLALLIAACKGKETKKEPETVEKKVDTTAFFPVKDFLRERINEVDSTPYFLYKITTVNGKRDSSVINPKVFDKLASAFLQYDITSPAMKPFYKETIFQDNSTNSYTISYTTQNDTLPVQSIDILISTDNNLVKRIFFSVFKDSNDSSEVIKMGWKNNSNFYINRSVSYTDGKHVDEENMIVWNN